MPANCSRLPRKPYWTPSTTDKQTQASQSSVVIKQVKRTEVKYNQAPLTNRRKPVNRQWQPSQGLSIQTSTETTIDSRVRPYDARQSTSPLLDYPIQSSHVQSIDQSTLSITFNSTTITSELLNHFPPTPGGASAMTTTRMVRLAPSAPETSSDSRLVLSAPVDSHCLHPTHHHFRIKPHLYGPKPVSTPIPSTSQLLDHSLTLSYLPQTHTPTLVG